MALHMKLYLTIVVVTVGLSCVLSKQIPQWMLHKTTASSRIREGDAEIPIHNIQRRQTINEMKCSYEFSRLMCQSGLTQQLVDVHLDCGENSEAERLAKECDFNSAGEYCDAMDRNLIKARVDSARDKCYTSLESKYCSTRCTNALEGLRDDIGCCTNTLYYLNDTEFRESPDPIFSYTLWSQCGVETAGTCASTVTVTPKHTNAVCSEDESSNKWFEITCSSTAYTILNALREKKVCNETILSYYVDNCRVNSKQQFCILVSSVSNHDENNGDMKPVLEQCTKNQLSCPANCKKALETLRNNLGCCINLYYNGTDKYGYIGQNEKFATSYQLWDQCNVSTPPMTCRSLLEDPTGLKSLIDKLLLMLTFVMV